VSWPLKKLKDITQLIDYGLTASANNEVEGPLFLRITDLKDTGVNWNKVPRCECDDKKRAKNLLVKGDIVFARTGATTGKSYLISDLEEETVFASYLIRVRPSEDIFSPYLAHFFKSPRYWYQIGGMSSGATLPGVNASKLGELEIPLPPLDEQKRIAAILDKADAIRRKRQQAIQLADDFLRSVFLDMFGADLQRNTNVTTFGDISILDAKMVDPREEEYLDLLHIGPDRIEKNTGKLLPALTAREERLISKKFLFDDQYILYSKIRPYLRKVAVPDFRAICSADMYPIKPVTGKVTREFLWSLLLSDYFDNYVLSLPARANIPKLNKTELAAFEFSLPDFIKVEKFTEIVKKSFKRSVNVENSFTESEAMFNVLSQKAFAGEL
jgi:type I restriction enzyme S subunit